MLHAGAGSLHLEQHVTLSVVKRSQLSAEQQIGITVQNSERSSQFMGSRGDAHGATLEFGLQLAIELGKLLMRSRNVFELHASNGGGFHGLWLAEVRSVASCRCRFHKVLGTLVFQSIEGKLANSGREPSPALIKRAPHQRGRVEVWGRDST